MNPVTGSPSTRRANLIASVLLGLLFAVAVFACAPDPVPSAPVVALPAPTQLHVPDPAKTTHAPQPAGGVVGSAKGHTYHRPDCEWAMKIHAGNRIEFQAVQEAVKKGYGPCRTCCHR